ncbi:MAG: FliG C-terminal domain-containing protein [Bacteriovoracaceae bacterium]|nr:FliG C-terminal domain-containing protein [Bacteriovoracaceae bacterium]
MEDIIINGRAQVIELLKLLPDENKLKILTIVKQKNPKLAKELLMYTVTFDTFMGLNDSSLEIVLPYISNKILALSLKSIKNDFQRKILKCLTRTRALEVFTTIKNDTSTFQDTLKAREKVAQILGSLYQSELL